MKNGFWSLPVPKHFATAPIVGYQFEDVEVGEGVTGRACYFPRNTNPSLGINKRALFLPPSGRRKNEVSKLSRFGVVIHVLHNEKVEPLKHVAGHGLVDPRVS